MRPIHLLRADIAEGAVRVDRFPEQARSVHTLNIHSGNFVGRVIVEATIKLEPEATDWFVVHEEEFLPMGFDENMRRNRAVNVVGLFTSMRATSERAVGFPHGIIDRVTVI